MALYPLSQVEGSGSSLEIGDYIQTERTILPDGKRLLPLDSTVPDALEYPTLSTLLPERLLVGRSRFSTVTTRAEAYGVNRATSAMYYADDNSGSGLLYVRELVENKSTANLLLTVAASDVQNFNQAQQLVTSADGQVIHLVYTSPASMYCRTSLDAGATWGSQVIVKSGSSAVNDYISIWCDDSGDNVRIAWAPPSASAVITYESTNTGASFSTLYTSTATSSTAHLTISADGNFVNSTAINKAIRINLGTTSEEVTTLSTSTFTSNARYLIDEAGTHYVVGRNHSSTGNGIYAGDISDIRIGEVVGGNIEARMIKIPETLQRFRTLNTSGTYMVASKLKPGILYLPITGVDTAGNTVKPMIMVVDAINLKVLDIVTTGASNVEIIGTKNNLVKVNDNTEYFIFGASSDGVGYVEFKWDKFLLPERTMEQTTSVSNKLKIVADPA